jgi:hypothetical protein
MAAGEYEPLEEPDDASVDGASSTCGTISSATTP